MDQQRTPELSDILGQLSQQAKKVEGAFADLAKHTDAAAAQRDARAQADWRAMQEGIDKEIQEMQAARAARELFVFRGPCGRSARLSGLLMYVHPPTRPIIIRVPRRLMWAES